jgi:hypothetical protein
MTVPTLDVSLTEHHVLLRDGTPVLIRPLVVGDAGLYPDFLSDVTREDLRLRFFAPIRRACNVRYWHLADMHSLSGDVRFRG